MKTIVESMIQNSYKTPDKLAVIFENDSICYSDLRTKAIQLSQVLKNMGLNKGEKVIVQGCYTTWFIVASMAVHLCEAVFVPVDKKPMEESIVELAKNVEAVLFIGDMEIHGLKVLNFADLSKLIEGVPADCEVTYPSLEDTADMMFTTGTTGMPKGVELTHKNLSSTAEVRVYECELKENNVAITLVPLNHVAPMRELYLNLYNGSTVIFLDGITKLKTMFAYIEKYDVTSIYIPPASISIMEKMAGNKLAAFADRIDYVYTASAPMQETQQQYMRKMLPNSRLYFSYGSSENGSVCLHRYDRDFKDITCCGHPCKGVDVKIFNDDLVEQPVGQIGRIAINSDMNMKGYYKREELNHEVFQKGYFLSNDIGYIDADGFLYVAGRKDDIINIGGLKVYPSEIETVALSIDEIDDCVCFPVDDPISGKAAKLLVKIKENQSIDLKEVHKIMAQKMDTYKVPKYIEITEEIARTSNGKVDRKFYRS